MAPTKKSRKRKEKSESIDLRGLAEVAREYFVGNQKQADIARRRGATQSAVTHWLARARALGIVSINVAEEFSLVGTRDVALSQELKAAFHLLECIVVDPAPYDDEDRRSDPLHTILANTAGVRLKEWIQSGDHVAIGGGRAPTRVAHYIRRDPPERTDIRITPLSGRIWVGSWQADGPENLQRPLDADDAARLLALAFEREPGTRFSQIGRPLYGDPNSVRHIIDDECLFNADGSWKTNLGFQPPVRALVGVGVLDRESGHRLNEVLKHRLRLAPRHLASAAEKIDEAIESTEESTIPYFGDVANRFFAAVPLPADISTRRELPPEWAYENLKRRLEELNRGAIVVQWEHLRSIGKVWAIAGGEAKAQVIWTLLLSRHLEPNRTRSVIKELTVDAPTARQLLQAFRDFEKAPAKTREWYAKIVASYVFA